MIAFNPRARFTALPLPGGTACWVVDDALWLPESLVAYAQAQSAQFVEAGFNAYPGRELALYEPVESLLSDFFSRHIRAHLNGRRTLAMHCRLALVTRTPQSLAPIQWLCHRDRLGVPATQSVAASVLYLFKDAALGGTSFFRPRLGADDTEQLMRMAATLPAAEFSARTGLAPGYIRDSNAYFEQVLTVAARWNRMIFYDGSLFHSPAIAPGTPLVAEPAAGRLTLNGFFTCRRPAR